MKKLLFLLLLPLWISAQVSTGQEQDFDYGIRNLSSQTVPSPDTLVTRGTDGTYGHTSSSLLPVSTATQTALDLKANRETGIITFDGLAINADPTKFNLGAGTGYITNSLTGVTTPVNWLAQTAQTTPYLATSVATYVLKDSSGVTVLQNSYPTNEQFRTHIYLGKLAHTTFTTISFVVNDPSRSFSIAGDFHDFVNSIGSINIEGNAITPNGANLNINVSAGRTYREGANFLTNRNSPNITNEPAVVATSFRNKFRNGSGGWSAVNTTTVDPNYYDNGSGILQLVANNKFTVKVVYRFGGTGTIHMDYGQVVYDDMDSADAGIANSVASDPDTKGFASRIGWIIIKQGTTSLLTSGNYKFVAADLFGVRAATSAPAPTLQAAYNGSVTPQITTTTGGGAVAIRRGSGADTDNILVGQNGAGTNTFAVTGNGNINAGTYNGYTPENVANKSATLTASSTLYPNNNAVIAGLATKQDVLISGTNIKTINGSSILGSGDLIVSGGSSTPLEKNIKNYVSQQQGSEYYTKWIEKKTVFTGGDNIAGTNVNTLRIPSIEHFSNGDLCMAAEARIASGDDDTPAGIAIYTIRQGVVVDKKIILPISGEYKLANAQLMRINTKMYLFYSAFDSSFTPNLTNEIKLYYTTSIDNGATWTARTEFLASDQNSSSLFKYLTSPGSAIYHSSEKILVPIWGRYVNDATPNTRVGMVIWDLKTNTFSKSLISGYAGGSEPALIEDTNSDVYAYFRVIGSDVKGVYYTSNMGGSWAAATSNNKFAEQCFSSLRKFEDKIFRTETMIQGADGGTRYDMVLLRSDSVNDNYDMVTHVSPKGLNIWGYGGTSLFANEFAIVSEDKPNLVVSYLKAEGVNGFQNIIGEPFSPYSYKPDDSTFSSSLFQIEDSSSQVNVYEQNGRLVFEDISTASVTGNVKLKSDPIIFNINERDLYFYIDIEKNNDSFFQALNLSAITTDLNNYISFRTNDSSSNFAILRVNTAGVLVDDTSTETLSGQFKVAIVGSNIKVYKWMSNSWTLILENTHSLFTNYQVQVIRAVNATSGEKTYLDNFIITNYDWVGKIPVKAD